MNDLANVLGLLAQSSTLSVPATVVLILFSPAWPVAMDVHANALPPVLAVPSCPAPARRPGKTGPAFDRLVKRVILRISNWELFFFVVLVKSVLDEVRLVLWCQRECCAGREDDTCVLVPVVCRCLANDNILRQTRSVSSFSAW